METFKLKNSLSVKLLKITFFVYLCITVGTLSLQLYFQYNLTQQKVQDEVISIEKEFKDSLSAAVWNFSVEEMSSIVKGINNNQFISGVKLLDKNNLPLDSKGDVNSKEHLQYAFDINREYKEKKLLIGKVEIYSDPDIVFEQFRESVSVIFINTLIVFLIISLVLLLIFYRYLTIPLNSLTKSLEGLNLENMDGCKLLKENIDLDKENKDEIELFKSNFVVMANKILLSSKELNTLNATLENKVRLRTENLEKEKNKFKAFLDATMEAILISKDGICIEVNQSAVDILGYGSKDELRGKYLLEFVAEESKELVKEKIKLDDVKPYEGVVLKKDKSKLSALLRGHNVSSDSIRISSIIDITHLKKLEAQSKMAALGEMIGNIAHQWRQPLNAISMSASGLRFQKSLGNISDEEIVKMCNMIDKNTQYLSKTIDDFRNYIKGDSEKINFNLKENIESFLNIMEGVITDNEIKIVNNITDNTKISGYPHELIQCYINLFYNSKDALSNREKEKYIFISSIIQDDKILITFKDNGGGIDENIIDRIFEPYFTTKFKSQGTGLGLHMTYEMIVNHMKGNIEAQNVSYEYNGQNYNGAEFIITIPKI